MALGDRNNLIAVLHTLLKEAEYRKKNKRSAAFNEQGHQKTPAFIHALLLGAFDVVSSGMDQKDADDNAVEKHKARGGFTDVGLHTGGLPRDTSWPLVREVIKVPECCSRIACLCFHRIVVSLGCRLPH